MGFEVWTLRPEKDVAVNSTSAEVASASREVVIDTTRGTTNDISNEAPVVDQQRRALGPAVISNETGLSEFHLCFLNYRSLAICLSIDKQHDVIPQSARRFCDDVALAVNSGVINPVINNLKWPGRKNEHASSDNADAVVTQRINGLPGLVLLFGASAAATVPGIGDKSLNSIVEINGRKFLVLGSIDSLCQERGEKKRLWQMLQGLRH